MHTQDRDEPHEVCEGLDCSDAQRLAQLDLKNACGQCYSSRALETTVTQKERTAAMAAAQRMAHEVCV